MAKNLERLFLAIEQMDNPEEFVDLLLQLNGQGVDLSSELYALAAQAQSQSKGNLTASITELPRLLNDCHKKIKSFTDPKKGLIAQGIDVGVISKANIPSKKGLIENLYNLNLAIRYASRYQSGANTASYIEQLKKHGFDTSLLLYRLCLDSDYPDIFDAQISDIIGWVPSANF